MGNGSILPSGEPMSVTPDEVLRYVNPNALRQILRQERLRWNLKPNKDGDYLSNTTNRKYSGDLHNESVYQRMEIRTFPDNLAYAGYAGINNDSGEFGLVHNIEKWDHAMTEESLNEIVNRTQIGASAEISKKIGYGLGEDGEMSTSTTNRMASMVFDPFDGRVYLFSNDDPNYVNNEMRSLDTRLPLRTTATLGNIPTRHSHLINDISSVSDPAYQHTDNNFTHSNRYILDNIDDRTFVYPEISKDVTGTYIRNDRIGLSGIKDYGESDGENKYNTQPDLGEELGVGGDRANESINSINANNGFSGVDHQPGYFPGIFKSLEELERVDLAGQWRAPQTHQDLPGGRRSHSYYIFDGVWSPNWFDRVQYQDSYLAQSLHPLDMEIKLTGREPVPLSKIDQTVTPFDMRKLYQWRYNRVTIKYYTSDIVITIVDPGIEYKVGDILRWSFGDQSIQYKVTGVGPQGQIQRGEYLDNGNNVVLSQDPSTNKIGVPFTNTSSVGRNSKLAIYCRATIESNATQIKNNLYAYVDVVPSVRSDNTTEWSDTKIPDSQGGLINIRSTASSPAYSGINSGRGGPPTTGSTVRFHEHGGNATAGVHVHLFRYVIDTQNPSWIIKDGVQVFTGKWVDQGPMGVERPCDIKALFLSNPDTNNFNNYYKFNFDVILDTMLEGSPDAVLTNDPNALAQPLYHKNQRDPSPDQKFYLDTVDPNTMQIRRLDVTDRVIYINSATGVEFHYNSTYKNDPNFGYGNRPIGWFAVAGGIAR